MEPFEFIYNLPFPKSAKRDNRIWQICKSHAYLKGILSVSIEGAILKPGIKLQPELVSRQATEAERLELFPEAAFCAACQETREGLQRVNRPAPPTDLIMRTELCIRIISASFAAEESTSKRPYATLNSCVAKHQSCHSWCFDDYIFRLHNFSLAFTNFFSSAPRTAQPLRQSAKFRDIRGLEINGTFFSHLSETRRIISQA
jgi:hypothetical protein